MGKAKLHGLRVKLDLHSYDPKREGRPWTGK